jgi:diguanylate cyclase (GGDEF)-like protein
MKKGRTGTRRARRLGWALAAAVLAGAAVVTGALLYESTRALYAVLAGAGFAAVAALATDRLAFHLQKAQVAAVSDPLTGLPNRVLLRDRVEQAVRRSSRSGEPFALVVVDLDGFKNVNDHHGHAAGDHVLRALARRFEDTVRTSDTVARVGGDEFVILSLGSRDEHEVAALVGRLRQALREPIDVGPGTMASVDASIGWAIYPVDGASAGALLDRADEQMFATKRQEGTSPRHRGRRPSTAVLRSLESSLHQGRVVVHYQPVLELKTGIPVRVEALVRGCTTARGVLTPVELVRSVEQTPLASALALTTVADALRQAEEWRDAGHRLGVAVNVPARALEDDTFADGVGKLLNQTRTPVNLLTLELGSGEGADSGLDPAFVASLSRLGVRISLADVIRSSSVAALRTVPIDELKIDATFVRGLVSTPAASRELDFEVVAEGVESPEALAELVRIGCDMAQGPYLAPAMPADELLDWLAQRRKERAAG